MQARERAARLERTRPLSPGAGERFSGYGLVGLAFESGHVLAFRRYAASSIGPPFTTLWQRDPDGGWVFHTNVDPSRSCPRYYGPLLRRASVDELELQWRSPTELWIRARDARLQLALRLGASRGSRSTAMLARLLPDAMWRGTGAGRIVEGAAALMLRTAPLSLSGRTPSGHRYQLRPTGVWCVRAAAAVLAGRDLGAVVPVPQPLALGDFTLPGRALLLTGAAVFEQEAAGRAAGGDRP